MDTLAFLQRVLPTTGMYSGLTVSYGKAVRQHFFDTVAALSTHLLDASNQGKDSYYAIASYKDGSSRKQTNTYKMKFFFHDFDCGPNKPYADWKEGLKGLIEFIKGNKLPKPVIVKSGNGLHAYWILTEEIEPEEWRKVAEYFKLFTIRKQCPVDAAITADEARVLRPPGTVNTKGGNTVSFLYDAPDITLETFKTAIGYTELPQQLPAQGQQRKVTLLDKLAAGNSFAPANPVAILSKCQQIKWAVENQDQVSEPMWYALIGVAASCDNPEAVAIAWSNKHPQFDKDATLAKLDHWKHATTGPALCSRFALERPNGCNGCQFKNKIKSPAVLGSTQQEAEPPDDAPDAKDTILDLPWPFKRTVNGIYYTIDDTDIPVCHFDLYPVSYGKDEVLGYETVRYKWNRNHVGWTDLIFRQALLVEGHRDFGVTMADQGIVLPSAKQTGVFQSMLRSYMDVLREKTSMLNLYANMGWKHEQTQFLLGTKLYKRSDDGSVIVDELPKAGTQNQIAPMYHSAGSRDAYIKFTKVLANGGFDIHMMMIGSALSSIFYSFVGLNGLVVNLYGPTGSGKTLAQLWHQSVWGDPKELHYNAKFTQNALFHRLSYYCNLPMTIDETTMMNPKEVGDFIYWVSQGKDKARLSRSAEERSIKGWSTLVTTSSNKSFGSMLVASGYESDAQQARLLDVPVDVHPALARNTELGERIYKFVTTNYGHIGPEFVAHFMKFTPDEIRAMLDEHKLKFRKMYDVTFTGQERYWETFVFLTDFALCHAQQLGIVLFDREVIINSFLQRLGYIREAVTDNKMDAFDLIASYLNEVAAETLTVMHVGKARGTPDISRMPRGSVFARFDIYKTNTNTPFDRGTLMLDRTHFRKWLATHGMDYRAFVKTIKSENIDATPSSKKFYMGRDTSIKLGQTYVIGINLSHDRLKGLISDIEDDIADRTLGSIGVVSNA